MNPKRYRIKSMLLATGFFTLALLLAFASGAGAMAVQAAAPIGTPQPPTEGVSVLAVDVTPPANQVNLIGQFGGGVKRSAIAGNYVFLTDGARMLIVDKTNPSAPSVAGKTALYSTLLQDVAVSTDSNRAYLAAGDLGVRVVNTTSKAAPVETGFYSWGASASAVAAVSNDYIFAIDTSYAKLWVISVQNPAAPYLAGSSASMTGVPQAFTVKGDYAYVVTSANLLLQYDISGAYITSPSLVTTVDLTALTTPLTNPVDVAVDNSTATTYAYVIGMQGLRRINLSTQAQVSSYTHSSPMKGIDLDATDGSVYLALENYGLQVLSLDLSTVRGTFTASPPYSMLDVKKSAAYLYAVDKDFGLRIIALPIVWTTPPMTLNQVAIYHSALARDVNVSGGYAYLASGDAGLNVVSVSNPSSPSYTSGYVTTGLAAGIKISSSRAYLAEFNVSANGGLQIMDVSAPAYPVPVGSPVAVSGNAGSSVDISSGYAYVAASTAGLQVISLSATPTTVASFSLSESPPPWNYDVVKSGDYAYLAYGSRGLRIVNAPSNPSGTLTEVGFFDTPGDARALAINGNYAYVADGNTGLQVINISNKASPSYAGSAPLVQGEAQDVVISGSYALVAAGTGGLRVLNISNPATPSEVGYYDTPGFASRLTVDGSYIYLADDGGGLFVLQQSSTPPPGPYVVSGKVMLTGSQSGLSGAVISSSFGVSSVSDASGNYVLTGAPAGAYTLSANLTGYTCYPSTLTGSAPTDVSNKNFNCTPVPVGPYSISGKVTHVDTANPIAGVVISDGTHTATTDASGNYTLSGLPAGSYTLSAAMSGYTFTTTFANPVVITSASQSGKNFLGTPGAGSGYSISGRITDNTLNPIAGVTVSDGTRSALTDSSGMYTISNVPYGSFILVPSKDGYSFSPASMGVAVPPSASGRDFKATINPPYTISGRITDTSGNPVANVTITDGNGRSTSTDANGNYTMTGLGAGTFTLTPSKSGFTFTPTTIVGSVPPNAINKDFTALPSPTYTVSGRVADQYGNAIAGVTVMDKDGRSALSDDGGNYTISGIPQGGYTITASKSGYLFSPAELNGSLPPNATGQNFIGMLVGPLTPSVTPGVTPTPSITPSPSVSPYPGTYTISGVVQDGVGAPLAGVSVSDGIGHYVVTDASGSYSLSGLAAGAYTVAPAKAGYSCSPVNRQVTLPPNAVANFTCSAQAFSSISGMIIDGGGSPIVGVTISDGAGHTAVSDNDGKYTLTALAAGTYTITPSKAEYLFSPALRTVTVPPDAANVNFYGTSGVVEIIVNGGFEKNEAWVMPYERAGYAMDSGVEIQLELTPSPQTNLLLREAVASYDAQEVHSGNRSMRVGILDPAKNVLSYSSGRQKVFIPAGAKCATLRFWLFPRSEKGTDSADFQMVSVLDENLNQIQRVLTLRSDERNWKFFDYNLDLAKVRGKMVWVYFGVFNDGYNSVMATYVDDVSLQICSKDVPPLPPLTSTPTVLPQQ